MAFQAGQFIKLGLPVEGEIVGRPFSFVNAPTIQPHEFYGVVVPGGPLSRRLAALDVGERIFLASKPSGFLVLEEVPDAENLWLLSTGTGIGPFLSILGSEAPWRRFRHVVLVHGTRSNEEQTYREFINAQAAQHPGQFHTVSALSGPDATAGGHVVTGRIPQAILDGRLESAAGVPLTPGDSQVMLCGNPEMIADVTDVLKSRGMKKNRRRSPGHITAENYW